METATPTPIPDETPVPPLMPPPGLPKPCNMDAYDDLIASGHTEQEAWVIVNTEMEGAYENAHGDIDSWQTYCHELEYEETTQVRPEIDIHPGDEGDPWLIVMVGLGLLGAGLVRRARRNRSLAY